MSEMKNVCGVNPVDVTDVLASKQDSSNTLIIDCRPFLVFNQCRIADSINIHCPPIIKRRSNGFIALENIVPCNETRSKLLKGFFPNILVYDDSTRELNQASKDSNLLSVIKSLIKQVANLTVRFIIGGFEAVKEECPVLCMHPNSHFVMSNREKLNNKEKKQSPLQSEPAEILPHLYLGDVSHSSQRELLQHLGITALLNVSSSCENHFESHYKYMTIQISDNMNADLLSWFPKVIEFIDQVAAENGKVLVHCRAGVSRSATVCIAYIMQKQGVSLDAAFEFIMQKRPIIDPNLNFIQQLQKFEQHLRSNGTIPGSHLLSALSTTLHQARSAPPLATRNVFTFSLNDQTHLDTQVHADEHHMDVDPVNPPSPPLPASPFVFPAPLPVSKDSSFNPVSPCSNKLQLSPSSLSQTAASPSPARTPRRPVTLPLLQVSSPLHGQQSPSVSPEILVGSSFLISPVNPASPFFDMIQHAGDTIESLSARYGAVPNTPVDRAFSFFGGDISCQSLSLPLDMASPRQCRPLTPTTSASSPSNYFTSEQAFSTASVPHTPISPLGTPLSPLPSFG